VRLLICAGGTGGGVYPALTVLQALKNRLDRLAAEFAVLWVGGIGGMEADLVTREAIPFQAIPAAGVHGVGWRALPGNVWRLGRGYLSSRTILNDFKPDVMLFTGGYVAVPMAMAGQRLFRRRIPSVLYVPDIEPGLALKTLGRFADRIAVTTDDSRQYFTNSDRVRVTGYPLRTDLLHWTREQAFQTFGLEEELPVLLVFGGSSGAQSINRALVQALPNFLNHMQVIHIAGQRNWDEIQLAIKSIAPELGHRYHAFPYLHAEMGAALKTADLVVSRAGASSLGEYPAFDLPAILVPYPYAWRYQQVNAEYLAKCGAAVILADADLLEKLPGTVMDLLFDSEKLAAMRLAMSGLQRPEAADRVAELVESLASQHAENRS
jgi:undecaprenyldiphospho-muramoylpentapeptide beta-N-acetylglucosaminyltransferase